MLLKNAHYFYIFGRFGSDKKQQTNNVTLSFLFSAHLNSFCFFAIKKNDCCFVFDKKDIMEDVLEKKRHYVTSKGFDSLRFTAFNGDNLFYNGRTNADIDFLFALCLLLKIFFRL